MTLRKVLLLCCLAMTLVCLGGGFVLHARAYGPLYGAPAVLVVVPILGLWWPRRRAEWVPLASLAGVVFLAAAGLVARVPAYLMVPGAAAALGAWDLGNLDATIAGARPSPSLARFERRHILILSLALGLGLLLAASGALLSLRIPFLPMLLLAGLDLVCLERAYRSLTSTLPA